MKKMKLIKNKATLLVATLLLVTGFASSPPINAEAAKKDASFSVSAHVADYGDMSAENNRAGCDGKRLEGITIECNDYRNDFSYRVRTSLTGWSSWKSNGQFAGSRGKSDPIVEVEIKLKGTLAKKYDCLMRVDLSHNIGFTSWGKNVSGSRVEPFYIEQVEFKLQSKGTDIASNSSYPSVLSVSPYEKVLFPLDTLNVTQLSYESYSHSTTNGIDCVGESKLKAPFTGRISYFSKDYAYCVFKSESPVMLSDGSVDYVSMTLLHGGNLTELEELYKNQTLISQNTPFYSMSGTGKGAKVTFPSHYEIRMTTGSQNSVTRGNVFPYDAFYLVNGSTRVVNAGVMESGNYMTNNAKSDYRNSWRWTDANVPAGAIGVNKTAVVKTQNALRRSGPANTYPVVSKLSKGTALSLSAHVYNQFNKEWFYDGLGGWIYVEHLDLNAKVEIEPQVSITNLSLPTNVKNGNIFVLKGTISSTSGTVRIKCVNSSGKTMFEGQDITPGSYEIKGSALDKLSVFNHLSCGNYKLYLYFNSKEIASCSFTVY